MPFAQGFLARRCRCRDYFDLCAVFRLTALDLAWPDFSSIFTRFCQWIKTYGGYLALVWSRLVWNFICCTATRARPQCTPA